MGVEKQNKELGHAPRVFPPGFLWGAATSAFQVEGDNRASDWWAFEQQPGVIAGGDRSGEAVDHRHRYKEDFALAETVLQNNAHRLSLEWSRIEPQEGVFDEEAIAHYRRVLQDLKQRNMKVMLTLHHFTSPQWLAEQGGFTSRKAVTYFKRYVRRVAKEYGALVDFWVTINEPMIYITECYVQGEWLAQERRYRSAAKVLWRFVRAHKAAYKILHEEARERGRVTHVGMANNVSSFHVYKKHRVIDHVLVALMDWASNHLFYTLTGKRTHDFLGLNYYFHFRIENIWQFLRKLRGTDPRDTHALDVETSDIGWELFPHGIFDVCVDLASYKKPIYITENGLATSNDDKRIRAIVGYLLQLHHAIQAGADVRGYFHWSLLDNYEWAKGYAPTFGLVAVDRTTMKRTPRPSAEVYGWIARRNAIEHDFLQFLGHGTRGILETWKAKHCEMTPSGAVCTVHETVHNTH